jgi:hypothetical protein
VSPRQDRPLQRRVVAPVVALPPVGEMGLVARIRLVVELLATYPGLLRVVRSDDLVAMAQAARAPVRGRITTPPSLEHATAIRLGQIVGHVFGVLPMDARCLIRSLVLLRLLERRSIRATLQIGVKTPGDFGAHAWVEHDGVPVLPTGHVARLAEF